MGAPCYADAARLGKGEGDAAVRATTMSGGGSLGDFLHAARERGFVHQVTDEAALAAKLRASGPVSAYVGFDCTADSLHVGHLLSDHAAAACSSAAAIGRWR
jgi:hypothetical protein